MTDEDRTIAELDSIGLYGPGKARPASQCNWPRMSKNTDAPCSTPTAFNVWHGQWVHGNNNKLPSKTIKGPWRLFQSHINLSDIPIFGFLREESEVVEGNHLPWNSPRNNTCSWLIMCVFDNHGTMVVFRITLTSPQQFIMLGTSWAWATWDWTAACPPQLAAYR